MTTLEILDRLEAHYGRQAAGWPVDPYQFLVWWHCGYPSSDTSCDRGWNALTARIGVNPEQILAASTADLVAALALGGMLPEQRAGRLRDLAARARDDFDLSGPNARKILKQFPGIADPGADRILLFGGIVPVAAVPSNCPQVLVRIRSGRERKDYAANYKSAQQAIDKGVAPTIEARTRAYLLLKRHGQDVCKRAHPKCDECPLEKDCAYFVAR